MLGVLTSILSAITFLIATTQQMFEMVLSFITAIVQFFAFLYQAFALVGSYSNLMPFFYFGITMLCLYICKAVFGR